MVESTGFFCGGGVDEWKILQAIVPRKWHCWSGILIEEFLELLEANKIKD